QGRPDEIYYFRDKDGHEADFVIPEGNLLHLYECKWHDESGRIPKNLEKVIRIVGEEQVRSVTTVTTVPRRTPITERFSVSNILEF
ncbi:DUF4143 domain-containing protein, partial [Myxococcota bacterium]|nr:DUF4143 domain-containing protein [Myxococcota bacterium]